MKAPFALIGEVIVFFVCVIPLKMVLEYKKALYLFVPFFLLLDSLVISIIIPDQFNFEMSSLLL